MKTGGISLDQAPPLSVPSSFFLTIPIGILSAACIMMATGIASLSSPWMPQTLALTHVVTLGVLAMGMLGALYQMTPVIAGTAVPFTRLAHIVHALVLTGLGAFIWRLLDGPPIAMSVAMICLTAALFIFLLPVAWALLNSATRNETVFGMRLAVISLVAISLIGLVMAKGYAGHAFPVKRMLWVQIHLTLALLGWVGGLIMAVSWQVIPMFYLASNVSKTTIRWFSGLLMAGLLLPFVPVVVDDGISGFSPGQMAAFGALPAALVIWLFHPVLTLRNISHRKRKRGDASLLFWKAGLGTALLLIPTATAALLQPDPRWQLLFGWLAIWGWAAMIIHGMLGRIVPFLVWFHRYSERLGHEPVPSMRSLLPQRLIKTGFILHVVSVVAGVIAIFTQLDWLARLTGLLLLATAISLANMLIHVYRSR